MTADLRDYPFPSAALLAAHNARQAEHYRYLARAALNLAAEARADGNEPAAREWTRKADQFYDAANGRPAADRSA